MYIAFMILEAKGKPLAQNLGEMESPSNLDHEGYYKDE
jgi:hypothetical protein